MAAAVILGIAVVPAFADDKPPDAPQARAAGERLFETEVRPIFESHCHACHSAAKVHGGLRLDERQAALAGGNSGAPVIEIPLAENELWKRVDSHDPDERMPSMGDPLSPAELAALRRWVELGAPWPMPAAATVGKPAGGLLSLPALSWIESCAGWLERYQPYLSMNYPLLALLVAVALGQRFRRRVAAAPAVRLPAWKRWLVGTVDARFVLAGLAAIGAYGLWIHVGLLRAERTQLLASEASLRRMLGLRTAEQAARKPSDVEVLYPHHPPRLGGTYYRGNDERSPKLFNGGFYCTCRFQLRLVAGERVLAAGDDVPPGQLAVQLEIERAPQAAPSLFSPNVIDASYLSPCRPGDAITDEPRQIARFSTLVKGERWQATCPCGIVSPSAERQELSGNIYLYNTGKQVRSISAEPQYGIEYALAIEAGRLLAQSELRMGVVLVPSVVAPTPPNRIGMEEWFDFRAMPEIEGENSTDPDLIGIGPHEARLGPLDSEQSGAPAVGESADPNAAAQ